MKMHEQTKISGAKSILLLPQIHEMGQIFSSTSSTEISEIELLFINIVNFINCMCNSFAVGNTNMAFVKLIKSPYICSKRDQDASSGRAILLE